MLLQPNHSTGKDAVTRQEFVNAFRKQVAARKNAASVFFRKVSMNIEARALRIDEHSPGTVVHEERNAHGFVGDLLPLSFIARFRLLPSACPIVVAGLAGDPRADGLRPPGHSADFHQAHRGAANFGERSVLNEALVLQHEKTAAEEVDAGIRAQQGRYSGQAKVIEWLEQEHQCSISF